MMHGNSGQNQVSRPLVILGVSAVLLIGYLYYTGGFGGGVTGTAHAGGGSGTSSSGSASTTPKSAGLSAAVTATPTYGLGGGQCRGKTAATKQPRCEEARVRHVDYTLEDAGNTRFHNAAQRHAVKRQAVYTLASVFDVPVFVETGTYLGEMVEAMHATNSFTELHTIEVYPQFYHDAVKKFAGYKSVHLYLGDSAEELPKIIEKLTAPAIFWLDGHYSGEGTGHGKGADSPLYDELKALSKSKFRDRNVILIDDMRHAVFEGQGYPTPADLIKITEKDFPNSVPDFFDDFFRIFPKIAHHTL